MDSTIKITTCLVDVDRKYLLLDSKSELMDRNIICLDLNGNSLWQVEEMYKLHARNYFSSIYFKDNGLFAYNVNGVEVRIDKSNGKFLSSELIK